MIKKLFKLKFSKSNVMTLNFLKYFRLWFLFSKEIWFYSYWIIFRSIFFLFLVILHTKLWVYISEINWTNEIAWIGIEYYIWYCFIAELVALNWRNQNIVEQVKSWNILNFLNKPVSFFWYCYSSSFFGSMTKIFLVAVFWFLIFSAFWNPLPFFWIVEFILFLLSFSAWILLLSTFHTLVWLFSFYFEDSTFIEIFFTKLFFIFWWRIFPIDIYPIFLQEIVKILPFQYFIYFPAKFFATWDINFFLKFFPVQILWIIILSFLNFFLYKKMIKRLEVNWG